MGDALARFVEADEIEQSRARPPDRIFWAPNRTWIFNLSMGSYHMARPRLTASADPVAGGRGGGSGSGATTIMGGRGTGVSSDLTVVRSSPAPAGAGLLSTPRKPPPSFRSPPSPMAPWFASALAAATLPMPSELKESKDEDKRAPFAAADHMHDVPASQLQLHRAATFVIEPPLLPSAVSDAESLRLLALHVPPAPYHSFSSRRTFALPPSHDHVPDDDDACAALLCSPTPLNLTPHGILVLPPPSPPTARLLLLCPSSVPLLACFSSSASSILFSWPVARRERAVSK
jgi:hypothetical protein